MGTVYRAWQPDLERRVALKVIRPDLASDATVRARFIQEARLAAGLQHPNAIPIHQVAEEHGLPVLVMRYVDGADLAGVLHEHGVLSAGRAVAIAEQAAAALDAAHRRGIVHRDVKPANILLERHDGREYVFLGDFGIAKVIAETSGLTETGYALGTLDYCAPEQIDGSAVNGAADTYALGCVAFEMLTGRVPFPADSQARKLWGHVHGEIPRVNGAGAGVSAALEGTIARAMAKRPGDRWPSPGAFAGAMRATLTGTTASVGKPSAETVPIAQAATAAPTRRQPPRPAPAAAFTTRRTRRRVAAAALAVVAVGGAGLAVTLTSGGSSRDHVPAPQPTTSDAGARAHAKKSPGPGTRVKHSRTVATTTPAPTTSAVATTTAAPTTSPAPAAASPSARPSTSRDDWPDGTDAYTAIVRSSASRSQAEQAVGRLAAEGYSGGVLRSDDYSHLRPGYWVAFSGTYSTLDAATEHAAGLRDVGFTDAYTRFVNGAG